MDTLIPDTADFRAKTVIRDKDSHYIMIKRSLLQKVSNAKFVCHKQQCHKIHEIKTDSTKGEINNSQIIFGDFNTSLSTTGRTTRQKLTNNLGKLYTIHQMS